MADIDLTDPAQWDRLRRNASEFLAAPSFLRRGERAADLARGALAALDLLDEGAR